MNNKLQPPFLQHAIADGLVTFSGEGKSERIRYDLHLMQGHIDNSQVATLARDIAAPDAQEFRNQYPAYAADIAGETRKALGALRADPAYRSRYGDFVIAMAYGERPEFDVALASVVALTEKTMPSGKERHGHPN